MRPIPADLCHRRDEGSFDLRLLCYFGSTDAVLACARSAASISAQDGARQRCKRPSKVLDPRTVPSGENADELNHDPVPSKVSNSRWPSTSQSLMASFPWLPVARRLLSGENATEFTPCRKPRYVVISRMVVVS